MKRKEKGLTVIELIIALAITSVVLGVIYTFSLTSNKTLMTTDLNSTLQGEGEIIERELVFWGTQASKLLEVNGIDISAQDIEYSDPSLNATSRKLNIIDGGNIKFLIEKDNSIAGDVDKEYTFRLNGNNLSLVEKVGAVENTRVLSQNVRSFNIRPIDVNINVTGKFSQAPGLEFIIILQREKGYSKVSYPVSTIVKFRNR